MSEKGSRKIRLLALAAFSYGLYLPGAGRGFVQDDFAHLYSAAFTPLSQGLTTAQAGPFFTPLVWLTFRLDWALWGMRSLPLAVESITLHFLNTVLVYCLALRLWSSGTAASWAAFGFALLFPANNWAAMYIATRAHALTTFFYLAALTATTYYEPASDPPQGSAQP